LELVVLNPGDIAWFHDFGSLICVALVHVDIRLPGVAVELRCDDRVVIQRPQCAVAEAVVEAVDLLLAQRNRLLIDPVVNERWRVEVRDSGPSDPRSLGVLEDRSERTNEPTGARDPLFAVP